MLKQRVITALCVLPILILAVWFDQPLPWFTIFVAVWALLALFEFYRLISVDRVPVLTYFGLLWTLLFILRPHFDYDFIFPLLLTSFLVLSLIWLVLRRQREGAFSGWVWTLGGILYIGWLLSYLVALRVEAGRNWVFFALFTTFASDTMAYFVGRAWGRRQLAPRISPYKTWEGTIGGMVGAVIVSLLFVLPTPFSLPFSSGQAILLGLLVSIFGQFGDLAKSLLKRSAGVKDSGNLLPGHGGVLDRTDSVVFAGVVVYYAFLFLR